MRTAFSGLSVADLTARLVDALSREKNAVLDQVFLLAELKHSRAHLELGYDSLFTYCLVGLGLERTCAYRRSVAAEFVERYSLVGELLDAGEISVSALLALKDVITPENHADVLRRAVGASEEQARRLASELNPVPFTRESITLVHTLRPAPAAVPPARDAGVSAPRFSCGPQLISASLPPPLVLTEGHQVAATLSKEVHEQLVAVKAALSHRIPDGNLNDVLGACFTLALDALSRQKLGAPAMAATTTSDAASASEGPASVVGDVVGATILDGPACGEVTTLDVPACMEATNLVAPTSTEATTLDAPAYAEAGDPLSGSRHVPMAVRRAVWARDGGCCSFVGSTGRRCGSTHQVEFDHVKAFALGGESTIAGVRLLCRRHNLFEAERAFGRGLMRRYLEANQ